MRSSVKMLRWAEASNDGVNVIYWETFAGTKHFITLDLDWYERGNRLPSDAMRSYCPDYPMTVYTDARREDRMYNIPNRKIACENLNGDPKVPYE